MKDSEKTIYVYQSWDTEKPMLIGKLYSSANKGKELFSFEYDKTWLKDSPYGFSLDPDLNLYEGRQFVPNEKPLFGIFSDSCPDRWGRLLMKRREAITARKEDRKPKALTESDYLLGVYDESRMGGLRFSEGENGPFLSDDKQLATPPWTSLRELESASLNFEKSEKGEEKWLKMLLAPGSSLGGARPKATVQAPDKTLWIAKFPSKHDEWDSGAWEMVTHDLAAMCGLDVPEAKIETFSKTGSTFLVKRFDRNNEKRIHFSSAMTLLGKTDGASGTDGSGYSDIADFIKANGSAPKADLAELWKRIVFNMAVSNTDDHLRNHAFILTKNGWKLSPLYDVNPNIYGDQLSLNVSDSDSSIDFELAESCAEYYGIDRLSAKQEIENIITIVNDNWKKKAADYGLGRSAVTHMEPAFDMKMKNAY